MLLNVTGDPHKNPHANFISSMDPDIKLIK